MRYKNESSVKKARKHNDMGVINRCKWGWSRTVSTSLDEAAAQQFQILHFQNERINPIRKKNHLKIFHSEIKVGKRSIL